MTNQAITALLGGSFDPPHLAHLLAAALALAEKDCTECWLVPCARHPFGKKLLDFETRATLCQAMVERFEGRLSLCRIEKDLPVPSYTVQTLEALAEGYPGRRFAWIIGSDNLGELPRWKQAERLASLSELWVVTRRGVAVSAKNLPALALEPEPRFRWLGTAPLPDISSSEIRRRIALGEGVRGLLTAPVAEQIEREGLYRDRL